MKLNVAVVRVDGFGGYAVIVGAGGRVVVIVNGAFVGDLDGVWLPSRSLARTWTV
jgi:hypothetical protein